MTKIDAVNRMLRYIGELPIPSNTTIDELPEGHEAVMALTILDETTRELQQERFWFNSATTTFLPNTDGYISIPFNVLSIRDARGSIKYLMSGNDVYDATNETKIFNDAISLKILIELDFDDLPDVFRTFVVLQSAKHLHMYLNGDETTQKVLLQELQLQSIKLDRENLRQAGVNFLSGTRLVDRATNPSTAK